MINKKILYFNKLVSTNDKLKELAESGAEAGTVIRAGTQTGGRGRKGRAWESAPGDGLYMSILLRPNKKIKSVSCLTPVTGLGVCLTAEHFLQSEVKIKWPNDIISGRRKLSGILLETSFKDEKINHVIAGIGININNTGFSGELADKATSFFIESGKLFDIEETAIKLTEVLDMLYEKFLDGDMDFLNEYKKRCVNLGREVRLEYGGADLLGIAEDISGDGELLVRTHRGEIVRVNSGEVSVRGIDGYV